MARSNYLVYAHTRFVDLHGAAGRPHFARDLIFADSDSVPIVNPVTEHKGYLFADTVDVKELKFAIFDGAYVRGTNYSLHHTQTDGFSDSFIQSRAGAYDRVFCLDAGTVDGTCEIHKPHGHHYTGAVDDLLPRIEDARLIAEAIFRMTRLLAPKGVLTVDKYNCDIKVTPHYIRHYFNVEQRDTHGMVAFAYQENTGIDVPLRTMTFLRRRADGPVKSRMYKDSEDELAKTIAADWAALLSMGYEVSERGSTLFRGMGHFP